MKANKLLQLIEIASDDTQTLVIYVKPNLTYEDENYKGILLEMPYITLDDNEVVDLELEVHAKMAYNEFIEYIKHWLNGDAIKSKSPGLKMHVNKNAISDFARKLSENELLKLFVLKNYGSKMWGELSEIFGSCQK